MHYVLFMYLGRFICLSVVFSCICVYQCGVINCSKPMHCVLSEFSQYTSHKHMSIPLVVVFVQLFGNIYTVLSALKIWSNVLDLEQAGMYLPFFFPPDSPLSV